MEGSKTVKVEVRDAIAVLTIDNPPVNQMSPQMWEDFTYTVRSALEDPNVKAIVITGTGKNFVAGADITRLKGIGSREEVYQKALEAARFLNFMEVAGKPLIAAINGNALGGGLEMAMACHYRVASKDASLGQPEVKIGLIPGAGGTQRLPRLVGLPNAIEMITSGDPVDAHKAYRLGLVDEVVEPDRLLDTAIAAASRFFKRQLTLSNRQTRLYITRLPSAREKGLILAHAKATLEKKAKGYIAPFKALEAMEKGLSFNIEADIEREVSLFADCAVSDVAQNLINIFLNTRAAGKLPRVQGIEPLTIKRVAVLGGGVMGSGIVHLLLNANYETMLWEINESALLKALDSIKKTYDFHIKKGLLSKEKLEAMVKGLKTTLNLDDLKESDLVIEAVVEDMKVKQEIWLKLEKIVGGHAIFGTNTSALPITDMASVLKDPGRLIGLHFFNPAHRMQLLEIICGKETSDVTLATSIAFARSIKKVPIVVNDGPGFYVSRQLGGLMGGSVYLISEGVDPMLIDEAMVEFGMPMGPATLADLTGIDINYHVGKTFESRLGERYKIHPLNELIYKTGCYGRKSGAGYYDYSGEKPVPNEKIMEVIREYWRNNNITPKKMDKQEIIDAMLALGINEAALMIEEGICDRPQDMDLAMIYGTGFPPYRGGILRYADKWGLDNVYKKLVELEQKYGPRFRPARLLKEMAEQGKTFY